jgi:hypothetical protein
LKWGVLSRFQLVKLMTPAIRTGTRLNASTPKRLGVMKR